MPDAVEDVEDTTDEHEARLTEAEADIAELETKAVPAGGVAGQVLTKASNSDWDMTWTTPTNGTVTSVGLSLPAIFSVSGSPVTESGTLTATLAAQAANTVWAGPDSGSSAAPAFRSLAAADIPDGNGPDEIPKNWRLGGMAFQSPNDVVISRGKFSGISSFSGSAVGTQLQAWDADLDALAALGGTGFAVRTAGNTWAQRSLTAPAAGMTISNSDAVAGNPAFALANDLAALEGLSGYGLAERMGTDTWTQRSLGVAPESLVPVWMLGSAAWQDIRRLYASTTWDPGSVADGAQTYTDVELNGAVLGDFVHVSCGADLSGLLLSGEIRAAGYARIYLRNLTGGPVDLSSTTFYILVEKRI
jgi:hypothetical protein